MKKKSTQNIYYFPLKIILIFLIISELIFWLGPIDYGINNNFQLFIYLTILNLSFYLGYKRSVKKFKPSIFQLNDYVISFIIISGLLLSIGELLYTWENRGISTSNIFLSVFNSITDPGKAYYSDSSIETNTTYLYIILSPLKWASIPIGIKLWRKNNFIGRIILILTIVINTFQWLGIGTRKGLFDIIIIIIFTIISSNPLIISNPKYRNRLRYISILSFAIFIIYFSFSNFSRTGIDSLESLAMLSTQKINPIYLDVFPTYIIIPLALFTSYLCQGYYALSLALNIGIIPLAPFGMSWFTISIAKNFGYDPTSSTYMNLLEKIYQIDMSNNWHTIYVWLANDVSFIGVPIIIYFIGYFLAQTWCDCVYGKNILSYPIMTLMIIMSFYFFANNQVLSFSFIPFIFWFFIYKIIK